MDFMRLLKSLEELLYEVVSWLIFYPRTLWLSLVHPARMMEYADTELDDDASEQYTDTLSPPLFLLLTLLMLSGLSGALLPHDATKLPESASFLADRRNMLMFRGVMFAVVPLIVSVRLLRGLKRPIDRKTLKPPFYSQCYVAAAFAAWFTIALVIARLPREGAQAAGLLLLLAAFLWYGAVLTGWFHRKLGVPHWRAAGIAALAMVESVVIAVLLALIFVKV